MLAILAPILVFGLVIFVHEFGHFLAAKAVGVYAPRFSIGFGPSIFKFRRGETEYILAWLPLGGYVRMASRHDSETAFLEGGAEETTARREDDPDYDPNAMIPFGPKPVPENRWFESKPLWARIVIMIAGVVMNIVLAIVVATGLVLSQGQTTLPVTVVGTVSPIAAAPELAQLHAGDTIRAVNGKSVSSWNDVQRRLLETGDTLHVATNRGAVVVPMRDRKITSDDLVDAVDVYVAPVIDSIVAGDPAAHAGLQRGDTIVSVNGAPVFAWSDMVDRVGRSANQALTFVVARAGRRDTLTVTPKAVDISDPATGQTHVAGRIGAAAKNPEFVHESVPFGPAVKDGVQLTILNAGMVFHVLHDIGSGKQSVRQLGGPIAITRAAVDAARIGLYKLLELIALLSINVAVLNLLPIPILDGGQILINVLESAKGSPFSMRTREYILRFGLLAIALLFAIVMYNDTRAAFGKLFGWVGRLFGA